MRTYVKLDILAGRVNSGRSSKEERSLVDSVIQRAHFSALPSLLLYLLEFEQ